MENIIKEIKKQKYNINDIKLLDIIHYKLHNEIISLEELETIKDLIDSSIVNIKSEKMGDIIYYKENEKDFVFKSMRYDSLIFLRVSKEILKEYYRNDLEYYLLENGYTNFILEEEKEYYPIKRSEWQEIQRLINKCNKVRTKQRNKQRNETYFSEFSLDKKLKKHKKYRLKPTLKQKIKSKLVMKKFKRKLRCMNNEKQK